MSDGSANVRTLFDRISPYMEEAPVNLLAMTDALGLQVDMTASLPPDVSGRITRLPSNPPCYFIEVNGSHSHARKRFTLAHEIAHYLLHRNQIGDGVTDNAMYRSRLGDYLETEANRMAAQLIMPANLVRTLWRSGIKNFAQLCQMLQVSEEALRIRLTQLRLAP